MEFTNIYKREGLSVHESGGAMLSDGGSFQCVVSFFSLSPNAQRLFCKNGEADLKITTQKTQNRHKMWWGGWGDDGRLICFVISKPRVMIEAS